MTTEAIDNCVSCVRAGNDMHYISNCKPASAAAHRALCTHLIVL